MIALYDITKVYTLSEENKVLAVDRGIRARTGRIAVGRDL